MKNKIKRYQIIKKYIIVANDEKEAFLKSEEVDAFNHIVEIKVAERARD